MIDNITLKQLTDFYLNESQILAELFGEKETNKVMGVRKEVIENIKNFSQVLSVRDSNIMDKYEIILN